MNANPRLVFLGSPEFAVPALTKLIESDRFKPLAVITQPDRPSGRNLHPTFTPIKQLALEHNLPVFQPEDINSEQALSYLRVLRTDLLVTVAYGQKLKKAVRDSAVYGAINLHPSLLPELRGAAPIPFALWNGMIQTGISIYKLTAKMDAGPVYFRKPLYIFPGENATDLTTRLAYIGAKCLLQFLQNWTEQPWEPELQDESKATYCRKLNKEDCLLDWAQPAQAIQNHIRALSESPGAYTSFHDSQLKILEAELTDKSSPEPVGTIVRLYKNIGFSVQTGDTELLIKTVQPAGKKVMAAWDFHLGARLKPGARVGNLG